MRLYDLEKRKGTSIYEVLYKEIRTDILSGELKAFEKLPSRRALASQYMISEITVNNAYEQLMLEGYIFTKPREGYFVNEILTSADRINISGIKAINEKNQCKNAEGEISGSENIENNYLVDFSADKITVDRFPFSVWAKLMRRTLLDEEKKFALSPNHMGVFALREAIANMMQRMNGVSINPDNIIIGAGTEYLYGQIIKLLGQNKMIAIEDPGHIKVAKIYQSNGVRCIYTPVDKEGIVIGAVPENSVSAVHISPSHHFPTGIVMSAVRRHEIVDYAIRNECYVIEDDYDSEFRFMGRPLPKLLSLNSDRVIYMNTFSKTLASSIRIAYMILPDELMNRYKEKLGFYSCTVSSFEQYTLATFINEGYFERHINRMKNHYRKCREMIISAIKNSPLNDHITIEEENAGLHFILGIKDLDYDEEYVKLLDSKGIKLRPVKDYQHKSAMDFEHKFIINYSDISEEKMKMAVKILYDSLLEMQ